MTKCEGDPVKKTLVLPYTENKEKESLKEILSNNYDRFFHYISTLPLKIDHREETFMMQNSSITTVLLPTTCFKVDFNDSFVTITAIKK